MILLMNNYYYRFSLLNGIVMPVLQIGSNADGSCRFGLLAGLLLNSSFYLLKLNYTFLIRICCLARCLHFTISQQYLDFSDLFCFQYVELRQKLNFSDNFKYNQFCGMSEQAVKKLAEIEQKIKSQRELLVIMNNMIKKQAMRSLKLQQIFKFSKSDQQLFEKLYGSQNIECYQEYSKLLSKRTSTKINSLIKQFEQLRDRTIELHTKIRGNENKAELGSQLNKLQAKTDEVISKMVIMWREQSYLLLNYRMDVAAKDLEKWSKALNVLDVSVDSKQIDQLFRN